MGRMSGPIRNPGPFTAGRRSSAKTGRELSIGAGPNRHTARYPRLSMPAKTGSVRPPVTARKDVAARGIVRIYASAFLMH